MFNPKNNNLLDKELSVSGLEMNWVGAAISGVASLVGGISGASEASKQNQKAKEAQKAQEKFQKQQAKKINKYNEKKDKIKQANYDAMYEYSYNTNVLNWQQGKNIQDFKYLQQLKQYQKSTAIGQQQLGLNAAAEELGIQAEQDALDEAFIQYNFEQQNNLTALEQAYFQGNIQQQEEGVKLVGIKSAQQLGQQSIQNSVNQLMSQSALQKETAMVENLISEGKVQLGQAGKSTVKAQQSNKAALHRSLMALESELSGKKKQAAIQLAELNVDTSLAEIGVGINLAKIDNAIQTAKKTAEINQKVLDANLESQTKTTLNNIEQIALEKKYADVNTKAGMMLMPEMLPYDPPPTLPPKEQLVKSMKATPGFVPPAQTKSTWAPLMQGITGAASAVASIDFGGGDGGGDSGGQTDYGSNIKTNINTNYFSGDYNYSLSE